MSINYKHICLETARIARDTGLFVRKKRETSKIEIDAKGKNDFVTQFDKEVEAMLVNELGTLIPEAGFFAEESTSVKKGEKYNWIIDPIDGTTNFIHGLYPYAISIALIEDNEIVAGVIYEVGFDECFYAWKSGQAMLNGKTINVSPQKTLADSLVATGFPYTDFGLIDKYLDSLKYFMENSHGVRRLGSAATDLAYLACGRVDAFYEYGLKPWDVAAGAIIVKQAGGKVTDFSGGENYLFGREIIATNAHIYDEFAKATVQLKVEK